MEDSMTDFTPDALRARFAALTEQREAVTAASEPLRARRDAIAAQATADLAALDVEIRAAEAGLFELDQERAMIARALGGRTGID
jgi:hypothetical protein